MLIDLLRRAGAEAPDQPAVVVAGRPVTYAEARDRAEVVAAGVHARGIARFGCAVEDPDDVVVVLAGASAAGSEACLYPLGVTPAAARELAATFEHPVVVTGPEPGELPGALPLPALEADGAGPPAPAAGSSPVLILTTGTTGHPRGARHDWSRLVGAVRHPDPEPGARWLLAYNLNQFAGVQVLLHVLTSRATLVAPPSRRARDVIATLRDERVTHVSATPTFWRLVAGALDPASASELSVRQITLGGEAVPGALLARLAALFPAARISQIYGATEFGTAVSVRDGRPGLPVSVLERGEDADVQLRIVGGQIEMRSRIGMLGYHREEAAPGGWRPTGDLVEVRGDRIHFVGRTSEIINVGGAKVHPLPIEDAVSAVDGVALARAYGRANPVTGQIVAVDVVPAGGRDADQLRAAILAACQALPPAARPRRIRFVDDLEIRGEKLARGAREPA